MKHSVLFRQLPLMLTAMLWLLAACGEGDDGLPFDLPDDGAGAESAPDYRQDLAGYWVTERTASPNDLYVLGDDGTGYWIQDYDDPYVVHFKDEFTYTFTSGETFVVNVGEAVMETCRIVSLQDDCLQVELTLSGGQTTLYRRQELPAEPQPIYMEAEAVEPLTKFWIDCTWVYLYVYDGNLVLPDFTTNADWARPEWPEDMDWNTDQVIHNGHQVTRYSGRINLTVNRDDEREAEVYFRRSDGVECQATIRQQAYGSMTMSGFDFQYEGQTYTGWKVGEWDLDNGFVTSADSYDDDPIYWSCSDSWFYVNEYHVAFTEKEYTRWIFQFSRRRNYGYDRKATVTFWKERSASYTFTVVQTGPLGVYGGSSGGSGGGTGGGGTSSDDTQGYTITRTSVLSIFVPTGSSSGSRYTNSWYKWVRNSDRKVILSKSATSNSSWVGVAANNYDTSRGGFSTTGYAYRYVDYSPVGGTWYYYFN